MDCDNQFDPDELGKLVSLAGEADLVIGARACRRRAAPLNVHFVYVFHSHHAQPPGGAWTIQPVYDALFGGSQDAPERKVLSTATTAACLAVAAFGWGWLDGRARAPRSALRVAEEIG